MWVLTRGPWPKLVNLATLSSITYQQITKIDPHVRLVAAADGQEILIAECANGDEARAVMRHLAAALASGVRLLDLNEGDRR